MPRLFELVGPRLTVAFGGGASAAWAAADRASRTSRTLKRLIECGRRGGADRLLTGVRVYRATDPARLRGTGLLSPDAAWANRKEFTALKFRTMKVGTDQSVHQAAIRRSMSASANANENGGVYKLERADAVTPFGARLRRTSLDELPQLINVFKGDMSLVGPPTVHPLRDRELRAVPPRAIRNAAGHHRPLAGHRTRQLHVWRGAGNLDVAYVRGWSLWLDLAAPATYAASGPPRQRSSTA